MTQYLAIVIYRGNVDGVRSGSIDFQVQWFNAKDKPAVRQLVESEPIHAYKNSDDQTVTWELADIFTVDEFAPTESGQEVTGFIASTQELIDLAESDDSLQ